MALVGKYATATAARRMEQGFPDMQRRRFEVREEAPIGRVGQGASSLLAFGVSDAFNG